MQSIDFHCCPDIFNFIQTDFKISSDILQETIWNHWSAVNTRNITDSDPELEPNETFLRILFQLHFFSIKKIEQFFQQKKKIKIQTKMTDYLS